MRKPPAPPGKQTPAATDEPADGRALQRARQFALQRGLPPPGPASAAPAVPAAPAAPRKRAVRKKP